MTAWPAYAARSSARRQKRVRSCQRSFAPDFRCNAGSRFLSGVEKSPVSNKNLRKWLVMLLRGSKFSPSARCVDDEGEYFKRCAVGATCGILAGGQDRERAVGGQDY